MTFLNPSIAPLGMGCWPIGGKMNQGERTLGYANADDAESVRTLQAALHHGISLFDTAAAYGTGHSERLLAKALHGHTDTVIVSKFGLAIDEANRELIGPDINPDNVIPALEASLKRLQRDRIDLLLLHLNDLPVADALPLFERLDSARDAGKIRAYGWSTDFTDRVEATSHRAGFEAVQYGSNVFIDAPAMRATVASRQLTGLIRSPLAMGLLTGKYSATAPLPQNDVRSAGNMAVHYFQNGHPAPEFQQRLDAVRDLLTVGGRSLVHGALGWLWAKSERNIPLPGARTVAQIEDIAGALQHGPLPADIASEIDGIVGATPEHEDGKVER